MKQRQLNLDPGEDPGRRQFRDRCERIESLNKKNTGLSAKRINSVKRLLKVLLRLSNEQGVSNACQRTIAEALCVSERAVKTIIRWAENLGILTVRCRRLRGAMQRNRYFIEFDRIADLTGEVSSPVQGKSRPMTGEVTSPVTGEVSSPVPIPTETRTATATEWPAAAASLKSAGVELVDKFCNDARQQGVTAEEVQEAVATYEANRNKLKGPGALFAWLHNGEWPESGIVDAATARARRERQAEQQQQKQLADRQARELARREKEHRRVLEDKHGQALDALPNDQLEQLAEGTLDQSHKRAFDEFGISAARHELLQALDRQTEGLNKDGTSSRG